MKTEIKKQSWGVITIECSSYKNKNGDTILERTVKYDDDLLLQDAMPYAQYSKSKDIVKELQDWASSSYKQSRCACNCGNDTGNNTNFFRNMRLQILQFKIKFLKIFVK